MSKRRANDDISIREPKIIVLAGPPTADTLHWDEDVLVAPLLTAFSSDAVKANVHRTQSSHTQPVWRVLPVEHRHLPSGLTQLGSDLDPSSDNANDAEEGASFLDLSDTSFLSVPSSSGDKSASTSFESAEEVFSQFYEHSIAIHDDIPTSQIVGPEGYTDSSFLSTTSESLTSFGTGQVSPPAEHPLPIPVLGHLSDLEDIPNAAYLQSITPQTMTVNLIVGIISLAQPRMITPRRGGQHLELVEMIVGDETKSGFGVNAWLPPLDQKAQDLRSSVAKIRPQDIVLLRNVALSSFRGNVYGQSLRKDMTKIDLLYRIVVDKQDEKGVYNSRDLGKDGFRDTQTTKTKKVRDWVMQFVGRPECRDRKAGQPPQLPDDTQ
ncbi:hypothetical protein MMC20_006217 [Loxospora ochrophaea]|nr:hypothetical protein [Loxospora ochrophaea]